MSSFAHLPTSFTEPAATVINCWPRHQRPGASGVHLSQVSTWNAAAMGPRGESRPRPRGPAASARPPRPTQAALARPAPWPSTW
eukprot:13878178-Alexandrium_andersonii.AAC.1